MCTCSQFPTEADSVDDFKSSSSTRGISMPNFEVLDARIASALNKIIHNSHFKRRISLEDKKPRNRTVSFAEDKIACLIYEYFWVTGANDSVENFADLFTVVLRNDDIFCIFCRFEDVVLFLDGTYMIDNRERDKTITLVELEFLCFITSDAEDTRVPLVVGSGKPDWRLLVALSRG